MKPCGPLGSLCPWLKHILGLWMSLGSIDIGDMFLNFVLHKDVCVVAGVDLTLFFPEELTEDRTTIWEQRRRCGMGFKSSSYNTIQVNWHVTS